MKAENYYHHLDNFVRTHGISRNIMDRLDKICEEYLELREAILEGGTSEDIAKEAADLLNVAADIIMILGGTPLWVAYCKLEEAAARPGYKQRAEQLRQGEMVAVSIHAGEEQ